MEYEYWERSQLEESFLEVTNYLEWLAKIVLVSNKDGKVWMSVDYRDQNKTSPKDNFSLPHIDVFVNNTVAHALFSFRDHFSGYNQIWMVPEDREKTSIITPWGTFY